MSKSCLNFRKFFPLFEYPSCGGVPYVVKTGLFSYPSFRFCLSPRLFDVTKWFGSAT